MLALHPRVVTAIWAAVEPRLPEVVDEHPLGCHRPRRDDFECFLTTTIPTPPDAVLADSHRLDSLAAESVERPPASRHRRKQVLCVTLHKWSVSCRPIGVVGA